ncbi:MAG: hypothetical protein ETSY1_20605 [Candidatus Entotheonella factor]|uniref:Uncharacterized protein n=1 Tax=Entotheonella factor TaxID=1429438 RepID=W4LJW7_ENTF1|nr:hypothetical protein [Candidatus Entotheonella palauensis]ETW97995.1 MAG: hypothetical protein ETSY1_20605 [Candidatus Entotheonella factor]
MAEKTVAMPDNEEMVTQPEGTRTRERYVATPVDIYDMLSRTRLKVTPSPRFYGPRTPVLRHT